MRRAVARVAQGGLVGLLWGTASLLGEAWLGRAGLLSRLLEKLSALTPLAVQNWLLGASEAWTKVLALVALLAVSALAAGAVALLTAWGWRYRVWIVLGFTGAVGLVQLLLAMPSLGSVAFVLGTTLLLGSGLWAVTEQEHTGVSASRRRLLRSAVAFAALLGAGAAGRYLWSLRERSRAPQVVDERGLPPALTPIGDFYVVSKNLSDPDLSASQWRLRIEGRVRRPLELDLEALRKRPAIQQIVTLECISNDVWGPYISTGEWIGVRLRDLLLEAEPIEPLVDVVFHAADGYSDSIPFSLALEPSVLLAYGLHGQSLPREHGFPLRLVVPGIYGMKNVKWITGIELSATDYQGFWQQRGWSDTAVVQIHSRIDVPRGGAVVPVGRDVFVGGIAFAGDRGIARVELSVDGGQSWRPVEREAPLSPYAWVRWWTWWRPDAPGRYRLVVRAWDGRGQLQEGAERPPLPEGATGWHRITVEARAPA